LKAGVFDPFMIADSTYAFNGSVQVGMYGGRDLGSALAEPLDSMGLGLVRVGAVRRKSLPHGAA